MHAIADHTDLLPRVGHRVLLLGLFGGEGRKRKQALIYHAGEAGIELANKVVVGDHTIIHKQLALIATEVPYLRQCARTKWTRCAMWIDSPSYSTTYD